MHRLALLEQQLGSPDVVAPAPRHARYQTHVVGAAGRQGEGDARPRIAVLVTFWGATSSHADWIVTKLIDGYWWDGAYKESRVEVASIFIHQHDTSLLGQRIAKSKGIPIFESVAEAVTLGGGEGGEPMGALDHEIRRLHLELGDVLDPGLTQIEAIAGELRGRGEHAGVERRTLAVRPEGGVAVDDACPRGTGGRTHPARVRGHADRSRRVAQVGKRGQVADHGALELHGDHRGVARRDELTQVESHAQPPVNGVMSK